MNVLAFWFSNHVAHDVVLHTHDFHQLIYCKSGGGYITVGKTRYKALSGHAYLAKQGELHSIEAYENMYLLEIKFFADDSLLSCIPSEFNLMKLPLSEEMLNTAGEEGIKGGLHSDEAANCAFKLFLIHTLRHFTQSHPHSKEYAHSAILDTPENAKENSDIKILNLRYYIEDRLGEKIALSELADEVNFSKTYFIKRFNLLFDMSPMKFINLRRIERSKSLIEQTELSLSEIAQKCGFGSLHYFSRIFKNFEGIAPNEYRKSRHG